MIRGPDNGSEKFCIVFGNFSNQSMRKGLIWILDMIKVVDEPRNWLIFTYFRKTFYLHALIDAESQ